MTKQIDDLGFLQRLLSIIQHQFGDQTRPVYVVGFSNGGFMALRLACAGTRLAGIAIVEASLGVARCDPLPMDLLQIHQLGDQIVPYLGAEHPSVPGASQPFLSVPSTFERWRSAAGCAARGTTNACARRPNRALSVSGRHARRTRDDARRESRLANPTRSG